MKEKRRRILMLVLAGVALLLLVFRIVSRNKPLEPMETETLELTVDGEFQYGKLAWNLSYEQIQDLLAEKLSFHEERAPFPEYDAFYIARDAIRLNGQQGDLLLEFFNNKLNTVRFSFRLEGDYEGWFQSLADRLTQLYGAPAETVSRQGSITTAGYRWNKEHTTLQLVLQYGEGIAPSGMVTMGLG